jgi:hypothetical protein
MTSINSLFFHLISLRYISVTQPCKDFSSPRSKKILQSIYIPFSIDIKHFLVLLTFPIIGFSQVKNEIWTDYDHTQYITEKLIIYGDATFRMGDQHILGFRPSLRYKISSNMQIMGGIGNNYLFDRAPNKKLHYIEIRPWQGFRAIWPQSEILFIKHYFRLEEQFTNDMTKQSDFDGIARFRYQIGTDIDIWENNMGTKNISIPLEYEIFHSLNRKTDFIQRDRLVAGARFRFSKSFVFELDYILQRGGENYSRLTVQKNIFRFRFRKAFFSKNHVNK